MYDRRDGIEECERIRAGEAAYRIGQRGRGEGPGCDNDGVPAGGRQGDFLARDFDQRMRFERGRHGSREAVAIDRQCAAGRHLMGIA